jgi:hypothetical protein
LALGARNIRQRAAAELRRWAERLNTKLIAFTMLYYAQAASANPSNLWPD